LWKKMTTDHFGGKPGKLIKQEAGFSLVSETVRKLSGHKRALKQPAKSAHLLMYLRHLFTAAGQVKI